MQLLKKKSNVDEEKFMELIDARKDSFYRVAYSYTRNREDALDVVSESVCKAYTHLHRLEDVGAFYPWFYRILSNTALSLLRKRKNHVSLEDISETASEPEPVADIIALRMELERLEQQQREILLLKFNDGLTFREIAELTGKNENSIKYSYYQGLKRLKERMEPYERQTI
ncbi:sigma-70 family RNA polymerase sigma factor [Agathobaculum sp. TL06]